MVLFVLFRDLQPLVTVYFHSIEKNFLQIFYICVLKKVTRLNDMRKIL